MCRPFLPPCRFLRSGGMVCGWPGKGCGWPEEGVWVAGGRACGWPGELCGVGAGGWAGAPSGTGCAPGGRGGVPGAGGVNEEAPGCGARGFAWVIALWRCFEMTLFRYIVITILRLGLIAIIAARQALGLDAARGGGAHFTATLAALLAFGLDAARFYGAHFMATLDTLLTFGLVKARFHGAHLIATFFPLMMKMPLWAFSTRRPLRS